ncbi:MAG: hypothetical protein AAGI49_19405, partial [Bacteroidota bacterium]
MDGNTNSNLFFSKNKLEFVFPSIKNLLAYLLRDLKRSTKFQNFSKTVTTIKWSILSVIRMSQQH